jgi:hypothetical protein
MIIELNYMHCFMIFLVLKCMIQDTYMCFKLSIISLSSRSEGTTQNKRKACRNQTMCFFKK